MKTLILSLSDIIEIVNATGLNHIMDLMIRRLKDALKHFDDQAWGIPSRDGFDYTHPGRGLLEWMPILKKGHEVTFKMVGYHPTNPSRRQLPTILSSICTYDTINGHLAAIADATFLTALRTGAASAVASQAAARLDSDEIGIIGCGAQAVTQLHALSRVFDIRRVRAYDIDPTASRSFIDRTAFIGLDVRVAPLDEVVAQSDIICSATSVEKEKGPVFQDRNVKPWLHINAVGSDFPGKTELPQSLLQRSFVFPDFLEQAIVEGECQQLQEDEIGPSLTQIVKNEAKYLFLQQQLSVFDSTGWALEDQLAIALLIERAKDLERGTWIQLESDSDDPKNPYAFLHGLTRPSKLRHGDARRKALVVN